MVGEIMLSKLYSCFLNGLDGYAVEIETYISKGLPGFNFFEFKKSKVNE